MSRSDSNDTVTSSSELVRWLQSLALPIWARFILVVIFLAITVGGLSMIVWALVTKEKDTLSSAISLLTVALPVSLIVIGLVFGQRSEQRLNALTQAVLRNLLPEKIKEIVCSPRDLGLRVLAVSGCRASYAVTQTSTKGETSNILHLFVEINVKKANVTFSLPEELTQNREAVADVNLACYQHAIEGALAEGYRLNPQLVRYGGSDAAVGLIFYKTLSEDFLLRPIEKLYFCQDLAFFGRGVLEAQIETMNSVLDISIESKEVTV